MTGEQGPGGETGRETAGACGHRWRVRKVRAAPPSYALPGEPVPRTIVLGRCDACGEPAAWMLDGEWEYGDFLRPS